MNQPIPAVAFLLRQPLEQLADDAPYYDGDAGIRILEMAAELCSGERKQILRKAIAELKKERRAKNAKRRDYANHG